METTTNSVFEYIQTIEQSIDEWVQDNSPAKIKKNVHEQLAKKQKEIMLKLLGFESYYGDAYKIDYCNGRAGQSAIGDYIKDNLQPALEEFVSNFPLELSPETMQYIHQDIQSEFDSRARFLIKEKVKQGFDKRIQEIQQDYLDAILAQYGIEKGKDPLEAYSNLMKLIGAKDNGT